jgi:hypothetical protein
MSDDDDEFEPYDPMPHLTVLDLPGERELFDIVRPELEALLGAKSHGPVPDLVAAEIRRRLEAREIEASREGLLRGLRLALTDPAHGQLHAEVAAAVAAHLSPDAQRLPRSEVLRAIKELLAVADKDRGYFMEAQREFLKWLGRVFLETLTRVEIDEQVADLLRKVGEYDTDAAIQLLERDIAFAMHPLVAFRLVTWRKTSLAAAEDPHIPEWAKKVDPTFAARRQANVDRAARAAKLLTDPDLRVSRQIDPENLKFTTDLKKASLLAARRLWEEYVKKAPRRAKVSDFAAAAAPLLGVAEEAIAAFLRPRGSLLKAVSIELARQYPSVNVSEDTIRRWLKDEDEKPV